MVLENLIHLVYARIAGCGSMVVMGVVLNFILMNLML